MMEETDIVTNVSGNSVGENAISGELIKVTFNEDNPTVSGRELHSALGVETRYSDWVTRTLVGFVEGVDFTILKNECGEIRQKGQFVQKSMDHILTLDTAKHICMLSRTATGKRIREYFIECEKQFWKSREVPQDPRLVIANALKVADKIIKEHEQKIATLEQHKQVLKHKVLEDKPKVEYYDAVMSSETVLSIKEVAALLAVPGMGQNNLFDLLRKHNILQKDNVPYRRFIDMGLFKVIEQKYAIKSGKIMISLKTLVTQRGIEYIRQFIQKVSKIDNSSIVCFTPTVSQVC